MVVAILSEVKEVVRVHTCYQKAGFTQLRHQSFAHLSTPKVDQCQKPTKYETDVDVSLSLKPKKTSSSLLKQDERKERPFLQNSGATDWFTCYQERRASFLVLGRTFLRWKGKG